MTLQAKLRSLQDRLRDSGWRIKHIPWQPDGKVETVPNNGPSLLLIVIGLAAFLGAVPLMGNGILSTGEGIALMIGGLVVLFASRFAAGLLIYRNFVPVEARCVDFEVREFEPVDAAGSLGRRTLWALRLLCEFDFVGERYRVTPIIPKNMAFRTSDEVARYLEQRISPDQKCRLWIDPKNPLYTLFDRKPWTPHTS